MVEVASKPSNNPFYLRTRFTVLLLLANGEMHGYQIIKFLKTVRLGERNPGPSTIYPILHRLEEEGLIKSVSDSGKRKAYRITEKGIAFLKSRIRIAREFMSYFQGILDLVEAKIENYRPRRADYEKLLEEAYSSMFLLCERIKKALSEIEKELTSTRGRYVTVSST
ncbi:MAG: PadR family transcriptional regulator [Desulfurococcales archaeon]|nr:PadR family transcriptional regulator [Desulfurococcales archaeon]MEB3845592.1 PadR family transcriptional regulator [Desulfurococcales archaeon]